MRRDAEIRAHGLLDWIEDPDPDRGVRVLRRGGSWHLATYFDLAARARGVAAELRSLGYTGGSTVAIPTAESLDFLASLFGVWYAGATAVPIPPRQAVRGDYAAHLAAMLSAARCDCVVASDESSEADLRAARVNGRSAPRLCRLEGASLDGSLPTQPPEPVLVQCTSGSTASPRGVELSEANVLSNVQLIFDWLRWSDADSVAIWLPLHHDMGLIGMTLTSVCAQTELRLMRPRDFLADPGCWLDCFGKHGATITATTNFGLQYAMRTSGERLAEMDFSSWRVAVVGAERVVPDTLSAFARRMLPYGFPLATLRPAYGLAEATLAVTGVGLGPPARTLKLDSRRVRGGLGSEVRVAAVRPLSIEHQPEAGWLSSCGAPLGSNRVGIVGESGEALPEGKLGQVTVAGPSVARGYRGTAPPASATRVAGTRLYTGDAGFVHDGELYVVGRLADSFKVRAEWIYAEELEAEIADLTGVAAGRCAVVPVGAFDDADGVSVVIEAPSGDWLPGVVALLRRELSPAVEFALYAVDKGTIPRTTSGKPRRRELWHRLRCGDLARRLANPVRDQVQALSADVEPS